MKKNTIKVAALGMALAMSAPVAAVSQPNVHQEQAIPAGDVNDVPVVKNRETGKIRMRRGYGTSPKQYGQWLQSRGRQRWTRSGGVVGGRKLGKQVFG